MFTRRDFIRIGTAGIGTLALRPFGMLPAMAQNGPDYRALVCVFLFGGNDSNNTIIPMDDGSYKAYTSIRGALALSGSDLTPTVTSGNGAPYAFHAKLVELANMFSSKELAVVANVGPLVQPLTRPQYQQQQAAIPLNLFSHSDQQVAWQTSIGQGHSPTGWAGRAADYVASQKMNSSDFPTFLSVAGNTLMGTGTQTQPVAVAPQPTLPGRSLALPAANVSAITSMLTSTSGVSLVQAASDVLAHSVNDAQALNNAITSSTSLKTQFPKTSLGYQLEQVALIIQARQSLGMRRQIFFVSLGGFDTHTNQLNTHDTLYPQLSPALAAFYQATQELGVAESVTTFTESDFSRTLQPTSSGGTDHAWGSNHLVMGGAVKGGQIYGKFPTFALAGPDDADTRGRWIPTTAIDQYGATLCQWFGIPAAALSSVFPNIGNFASNNLGFLG